MNNIEDSLRQSLLKGCKYFPKLFPFLLKTIQNPAVYIKTLTDDKFDRKYKSGVYLLSILNTYVEDNFPIIEIFDNFEEFITDQELIHNDYYKFKNGYLYTKNFDSIGLNFSLEFKAIQLFDDYTQLEYVENTGISKLDFAKNIYSILNKLYKNYNPEKPLSSSREYIEYLFLDKVKEECLNINFLENYKKNNEF